MKTTKHLVVGLGLAVTSLAAPQLSGTARAVDNTLIIFATPDGGEEDPECTTETTTTGDEEEGSTTTATSCEDGSGSWYFEEHGPGYSVGEAGEVEVEEDGSKKITSIAWDDGWT